MSSLDFWPIFAIIQNVKSLDFSMPSEFANDARSNERKLHANSSTFTRSRRREKCKQLVSDSMQGGQREGSQVDGE
jgi:hypothetical protein